MPTPRVATALLRLLLEPEVRKDVLADLESRFEERAAARGRWSAWRWYWAQTLAGAGPAMRARFRTYREGPGLIDPLLQDLRHTLRQLRRRPGTMTTVVLLLALGIGANSAIFSVIKAVLLDPLPYEDSDRIMRVVEIQPDDPGRVRTTFALEAFREFRAGHPTVSHLTGYLDLRLTLTGAGDPVLATGYAVPASFFALFGVSPRVGRALLREEEEEGRERVVVLGHSLWEARLGSDPGMLGRTVGLAGADYEVVGIMPPDFRFNGSESDFWIPLVLHAPRRDSGRPLRALPMILRLADGVTSEQASAEANAVLEGLRESGPPLISVLHSGRIELVPLKEDLVGGFHLELWVLQGAVLFVLLIACSNVASLLLARALTREREVAVRTALGCGRNRLFRQLLTESTVLALLGGVVGSVLAVWGVTLIIRVSPDRIPRLEEVGLDGSILAFSLALSLITGILFGFAPGLRNTRAGLCETLSSGGRPGAGPPKQRLRNTLVVTQVALALMLAVGAGLLVSSLVRLNGMDTGYDPRGLATLEMDLPPSRYARASAQAALFDDLLARVEQVSSVEDAAVAFLLPLSEAYLGGGFLIEGRPDPVTQEDVPWAGFNVVSPSFFRTVGIPIVSGTGLSPGTAAQVVISQALADRFFPGEDPLGEALIMGRDPEPFEIVGVAGNVREMGAGDDPDPLAYFSYRRVPRPFEEKGLVVGAYSVLARTDKDPVALTGTLRDLVLSVDPGLAVFGLASMEQRLSDSVARSRFYALFLSALAVLALALVGVGIYGMAGYFVSHRVHEIGVRTALGARPTEISGLILRQGLSLTFLGACLGLAGAWSLRGVLSGFLYGVSPAHPPTYLAITGLLLAVALFSLWKPVRKATRVDPVEALRSD